MANYANELSGKWLKIIKEIFLPKTGMWEKQLLQDPGYVKGSKLHAACCMVSCKVYKYPISKESKEMWYSRFKTFISYVKGVESAFDLQCRF